MMRFREVKQSLINNVLGPAEAGRFQTIGFQRQKKSAEENKGNSRTIQVYYNSGDFPTSRGSLQGPNQHDLTFKIDITVSEPVGADLSVLRDNLSTPAEKAAALLLAQESAERADNSIDELFEIVYQIVMDARNINLGIDTSNFRVANRWIGQIQKDDGLENGDLFVITGSMQLTCRVSEDVTGDTPTLADTIETKIEFDGDPNENTGVTVNT
jgi:hypothetical protein